MKTYFKIFCLVLLPVAASAQLPTISTDTKFKVIEGDKSWYASIADMSALLGVAIPETEIPFGNASSDGLTSSPGLTYDGDFLHVTGDVDITHENAALTVDDVAPSGASQGGTIGLNSKDGAALADGDRVGGIAFIGSTGISGTAQTASIDAVADGAWSGTSAPGQIILSTTPDGSLDPVQRLILRESGNVEFLNAAEWRFYDSDNSNYLAFKAGSMSSNNTLTWPTNAPTDGQQLTWNTGNILAWGDPGGGGGISDGDKGDITVSSGGTVWDIDDGAVALSNFEDISTNVFLGNAGVSPGPPLALSMGTQFATSGATAILAQNGAATNNSMIWNGSAWAPSTVNLASSAAVTGDLPFSNITQLAGLSLLGRSANSTGDMAAITGTVQTSPQVRGTALGFHPIPSKTYTANTTIPTSVNETSEIGVIKHSETGRTAFVQIDLIIKASGISCLRRYEFPLIFASTGGSWVRLLPSVSNGAYSGQDFELEMRSGDAGSTPSWGYDTLRLVRTQGSVAGTAETLIQFFGTDVDGNDFTETTHSDVSSTTAVYARQAFSQVGQSVGINTANPGHAFEVVGDAGVTGAFYDSNNEPGTSGQVLSSTATGTAWIDAAGGVSDGDKGDITVSGSGTVWNIDAGVIGQTEIATNGVGSAELEAESVLYSKIQNVAANSLVGNPTGGANDPTDVGLGAGLGFSGGNLVNTGDTDGTDDAPIGASYITTGGSLTLTNERTATMGVNMKGTDAGANLTYTFDALAGNATESTLTADVDNYTSASWSTATTHYFSSDASQRAITSFTALPDGTIRRLVNTGTYPIYIPGEHPDGTAANRVICESDRFIGPNGGMVVIFYDGNVSRWRVENSTFNPSTSGLNGMYGQFYNIAVGATITGDWGDLGIAGNADVDAPASPRLGSYNLNTSTSATGSGVLYFTDNVLNPTEYGLSHSVGSALVYTSANLSSGTQTYTIQSAFIPSPSSTTLNVNNSVGIRYTDGVNSGKWQGFSRNSGGTESTADLGITVAANTAYILTVCMDKANTEARFYINGAYAGRVTSNLPTSGADYGFRTGIFKTVGTTLRNINIPWLTFYTVTGI